MSNEIFITCDRCKKIVYGSISKFFTGGFYKRSAWSQFMNDGENNICDECMWKNEKYQKLYGLHDEKPIKHYYNDCKDTENIDDTW